MLHFWVKGMSVCLRAIWILPVRCCCRFKKHVIKLIGVTQLTTWLSTEALSCAFCRRDELHVFRLERDYVYL